MQLWASVCRPVSGCLKAQSHFGRDAQMDVLIENALQGGWTTISPVFAAECLATRARGAKPKKY